MKQFLIVFALMTLNVAAFADSSAMQEVINKQSGNFYVGALPADFKAESVDSANGPIVLPFASQSLTDKIDELVAQEKVNWADYVRSSPWEFFSCSSDTEDETAFALECYLEHQTELDAIIADPQGTIGLEILEVEMFHKIYKNGNLVGYVIEYSNNVDASIIQDGSGIVIYLDVDMNVLKVDDWQS